MRAIICICALLDLSFETCSYFHCRNIFALSFSLSSFPPSLSFSLCIWHALLFRSMYSMKPFSRKYHGDRIDKNVHRNSPVACSTQNCFSRSRESSKSIVQSKMHTIDVLGESNSHFVINFLSRNLIHILKTREFLNSKFQIYIVNAY